jgi:hypothetical protein
MPLSLKPLVVDHPTNLNETNTRINTNHSKEIVDSRLYVEYINV